MNEPQKVLGGVFVGGASRRMGGSPKGLLLAPGSEEPLLVRTLRVLGEAGIEPILVGDATPYAALDLPPALPDAAGVSGPLGGLAALLEAADGRPCVALACDMPRVSVEALHALLSHAPEATVVAPRRAAGAPWDPFFARYDAAAVAPLLRAVADRGVRSFQKLFAGLDVSELPLSAAVAAALEDWDTPEDVQAGA